MARRGQRLAMLLAMAFLALGRPALAEGGPDADYLAPRHMTPGEFGRSLESARDGIAGRIDAAATFIDSFFGDERYVEEVAETRLRIGGDVLLEPGEAPAPDIDFNLRLVLPNTQERLRLVVDGVVRDEETSAAERDRIRAGTGEVEDRRRFTADLRYTILEDLEEHLDARSGLRLDSFVPAGVVGLRYRRTWLPDSWLIRMSHEVEWETIDGFELKGFLDFETEPGEELFFRTTPEIRWRQEAEGLDLSLSHNLTQRLGEERFLQYALGFELGTEPRFRLEGVTARARYRQTVLRHWIRAELAPQLRFPEAEDYDPTPGLRLGLEVVF